MANKNFIVKNGLDVGGNVSANSRYTFDYNDHYLEAGTNSVAIKNGSGTSYLLATNTGVTIPGNLTVEGTSTTLNVATLDVEDKNIKLNKGSGDTSGSADGAGITIQDAVDASTDATILWDATNDDWKISHDLQIPTKIRHTGDLNTYLSFANNADFRIVTGNSTRAAFSNSQILFNQENANQDFRVDGTNDNLLFCDASGNKIGIGTASPLDLLHLNSSSGDVRMLMNAPTDSDVEIKYSENGTVKFTTGFDAGIDSFVIGTTNVDTERRLVIDSSGNIGIGTSSPGVNLDIESSTNNAQLELTATDGTDQSFGIFSATGNNSNGAGLFIQDKTASGSPLRLSINSGGRVNINNGTAFTADGLTIGTVNSNCELDLSHSSGKRYRLNSRSSGILSFENKTDGYSNILAFSGQNVGIGTDAPAGLLTITGSGDAIRVESTNSGAGGAQMDLLHFSASPADEDTHGAINFGGYYSGSSSAYGSAIRSIWTDVSARHSRLEFLTRDDSAFPSHMTLTHTGDLLVGSSTNLNVLSGTPKIQVGDGTGHSSIQWYSGTGSVGGLYFGDGTSGIARYPGYIEYRHNNNSFGFQANEANALEIRSDRLDVARGSNEARITINSQGTAGTNNSNWIRASGQVLMYNSAGSDHRWEIGGTQHMELKASQSASTAMLSLTDTHPWIDLVAPDGQFWRGGMTMRGGSSSTQAQCHFHMCRHADMKKLSTAGDYDAYIVTETANASSYGDFLIGTDGTESMRFHAAGQEVSIGNTGRVGSSAKTYLAVGSFSGSSTISICSSTSGYGYLNFADGTSGAGADPGYMRYNHNDNTFYFNRNVSGPSFSSDISKKENVVDIADGWSVIKDLKPRIFDWKKDERTNDYLHGMGKGAAGFIAQEVETVLPNEVHGEDGEKGISPMGIIAHLVKTVQELEARIKELEG